MKTCHRLMIAAAAALLAACGSLRGGDPGSGEYWIKASRPQSRSESLLYYFEYVRGLAPSDYNRESEAVRQLFASDKSDFTRLRYALALSIPGAGARELQRAQQAIESVRAEADGRDPGLRALAVLLAAELAERRRLEDHLQAANQRQREEQSRAASLEQKLEALKSIEKSLEQRDRKPGGASPAPGKRSR